MTYGRNGQSPIVGLGKYKLNQWFHISIISSYLYSKAGALVMLLGTIIWSFSNLIWLTDDNYLWVSIITLSLIISSTSFVWPLGYKTIKFWAGFYSRQRYFFQLKVRCNNN